MADMSAQYLQNRASGILLHITSLPSLYGIGDIGPGAYKFVDFLSQAKQSLWQVLPLNPIEQALGNSPYSSISCYASNTLLISPELMVKDGLLKKSEIEPSSVFSNKWVDYGKARNYKEKLFNLAYERFKQNSQKGDYEKFLIDNSSWLNDFVRFVVFKKHFHEKIWNQWPNKIRDRQKQALQRLANKLNDRIEKEKFLQYLFFKQWFSLKQYCNQKGIRIIGDIPIYVNYDSADVWIHPEIFKLNKEKKPIGVSGVPPDYFSKTGQLWGNPVYRWEVLRNFQYAWWIERFEHNLKMFDIVRIDHFRGFVAYWEVPTGEKNAINGKWIHAPAEDFFNTLFKKFPSLPIIAEDLGTITDDVKEIMRHFGFPGMRILLFAFGEDNPNHPYLPHNYINNCVVYTGTHDNNTIKGWFKHEATYRDKQRLFYHLGRKVSKQNIHWELIRFVMTSVANTVIFSMQDILGLDQAARMNQPATAEGNWQWRLLSEQLTPHLAKSLLEMTESSKRLPQGF
jgi:4-alpha-glucanotransferase